MQKHLYRASLMTAGILAVAWLALLGFTRLIWGPSLPDDVDTREEYLVWLTDWAEAEDITRLRLGGKYVGYMAVTGPTTGSGEHVAIFDQDGDLVFHTPDSGDSGEYYEWDPWVHAGVAYE